MKKCPFCAEAIQDEAIKCRFCGSSLTVVCPECNTSCADRVTQCPQCGYPLGQCPDCGHANPSNVGACQQCGRQLRIEPPPRAGSVAPPHPGQVNSQQVSAGPQVQPPSPSVVQAQPIPGALAVIPVEPRAFPIALGLALSGLSIWLIASWLPSHRPMSAAEVTAYLAGCASRGEVDCLGHHMINPALYPWTYLIAAVIGLAGVEQIIRGATYRAFLEVTCHTCKTKVVGKKTFMGIQCPTGQHLAEQRIGKLALLIVLVIVLIAMANK